MEAKPVSDKYMMTISRLTVDKLGVKLYDKVSAVIAELVANGYDADAKEVKIWAPMGEYLATKVRGEVHDKGYEIIVEDDGIGMDPTNINDFYLKVGAERRRDARRGDTSPIFGRKVMGCKGVGKLAPFGICEVIEVITSGGPKVTDQNEEGKTVRGYRTAHFILDRKEILYETDEAYHPKVGELDGTVRKATGTIIKLKSFSKRQVPTLDGLERQMAQRFGIRSEDWKIFLHDTTKTQDDANYSREVGIFCVDVLPNTKITFDGPSGSLPLEDSNGYRAIGPEGDELPTIKAGFVHEDGKFYPVTGWVGYSKNPYSDDLMAGIRVYCRGKIAAQTTIFGKAAGFTGEYDIRSYMVGELNADWLDVSEDLIQTDRRDILWSHELGQSFQEWGRKLIGIIGRLSRDPMRKSIWETFREVGQVENRVNETFPGDEHKQLRDRAKDIIKMVGTRIRREELEEPQVVSDLVELGLWLAPHIILTDTLRESADASTTPLEVVTNVLRTARIAELSSFGRIAENRIKVIEKLETLKNDPGTTEDKLQKLIYEAPWLINPQWSPLTANQAFATLKAEFERFYEQRTGRAIVLNEFSDPSKRCDFVLSTQGNVLQVVEIKKPNHRLDNSEMERITKYLDLIDEFLNHHEHQALREFFRRHHLTLVCDRVGLSGVHKRALDGLKAEGRITLMSWMEFLFSTKRMHESFMNEAERQRKHALEGE